MLKGRPEPIEVVYPTDLGQVSMWPNALVCIDCLELRKSSRGSTLFTEALGLATALLRHGHPVLLYSALSLDDDSRIGPYYADIAPSRSLPRSISELLDSPYDYERAIASIDSLRTCLEERYPGALRPFCLGHDR